MGQADAGTKFTLVQALRGIAALWVVLFHAAEGGHLAGIRATLPRWLFDGLFEAGHYGVAIFFALSGFVIAHSLRAADVSPRFAGRFVLRRAIRLDPPYWATIALVLGYAWVEARVRGTPPPPVDSAQVAAHLVYAQALLGYPHLTGVFWTLCFEVQFYLAFIGLLTVDRRMAKRYPALGGITRLVMLGAALGGALGLYGALSPAIALVMWHSFFVGVAAYWAGQGSQRWAAALVALAAVMIVRGGTGDAISAATALLLFGAMRTRHLTTALSGAAWQWLGLISYSLYLTHNIVTGALYWLAGRLLPSGLIVEIATLVGVTAACLAVAFGMWWLVERPAHAFARRIGKPRSF